ncbi:thermonuclease family protein [Salirhabdus sp. Marseille-P4669]|uniref:thermonuclease family protein n=1 Tax=Salirhabdus sp. Marseille-P4669 TaxID=2042310 RepID=UPI0011AFAD95|nr:thermonuclease family protein [Salirhabdus sp. Marseille-P4669]
MRQIIVTIIAIVLVIAIIGFIIKHFVGFLGIGIAVYGLYKWKQNREQNTKSTVPVILMVVGVVLAFSWFANPMPNETKAPENEKQEYIVKEEQEDAREEKEKGQEPYGTEEKDGEQTPAKEDEKKDEQEDTIEEKEKEQEQDGSEKNDGEQAPADEGKQDQPVKEKEEAKQPSTPKEDVPKEGFARATVTRVVDGDTIELRFENGTTETIRLLLVDTPETKHPSLPVQQFGPEASQFAKKTLLNKQVQVEYDGPKRDKYDRLLGYLWIGNSIFNQMLLEEGLARYAYVYDPPYTHSSAFMKAQNRAKNAKKGIWSIDGYVTADGFNQHEEEKKSSPNPQVGTSPYTGPYDPSGPDRDCGDFRTQEEAQAFFIAAGGPNRDPHNLDGTDGDGFVCESLP